MKRVKSFRLAAVVVAAILAGVMAGRLLTAGLGAEPRTGPALVTGNGPEPQDDQFIYTVQADVPGVVKKVETWASVDGTRNGAVRWTRCSTEGNAIPQCLILLPKGRGPDKLNDRTYAGIKQMLPTDPALLAAYLERHNSCNAGSTHPILADNNQAAFAEIMIITDAIQVLPPGYGKLLFQAATKIPGTNVLARVTDAAGGSGTAVSMVESDHRVVRAGLTWGRFELIFTPGTYQYLGSEYFSGPSARGPWKLASATSLRSYRFVSTAPHDYTGDASMGSSGTLCISP